MSNHPKTPHESPPPSALERSEGDGFDVFKEQLLASINHEVRTPLTGILGLSDLLLESQLTEEQREWVQATRVCAETLLHLLNSTLEFAALSAGKGILEQTEFPLRETLRCAAEKFRPQAEAKGLGYRVLIDASVPELALGDSLRLQQLLGHLISNAVKFTHEGSVTVHSAANSEGNGRALVTVSVIDTGIGIDPRHRHLIFESFRQLDSTLSRRYPGLGLGLALAQKIVQLFGGTLDFESTPGKGSCFSFTIPLTVRERPAPPQPASGSETSYRILVVEDNKVAREVVQHILKRRPFEVEFAESGEQAIEAVSKQSYDLILMDLQMPGLDGFQTTERIRRHKNGRQVPVVALTANDSGEHRALCRQCGMQGFLSKPVQAEEMLRTLDALLMPAEELHTPSLESGIRAR